MELGMVGLGRMGGNMVERLLKHGHTIVAYDRSAEAVAAAVRNGAVAASSLEDLVKKLKAPRAVWVMVPSGDPTQATIDALARLLSRGDTMLDGGNSYYKDSIRRGQAVTQRGISFLDVGTSGGIWGLREGYSLMVGGDEAAYKRLEPIFQSLAPFKDIGHGRVGPLGAGHFVKMVHNGIEYGMMQALSEGFELMDAKKDFDLDLHQVSEIWRHGSVVRSWLLDLAALALKDDPDLSRVASYVEDSGEGRWTVQESIEQAVPLPVIALALQMRFRSRQDSAYSGRMLAALRNQFGGHAVRKAE